MSEKCLVCGEESVCAEIFVINSADVSMPIEDCEVEIKYYCNQHKPFGDTYLEIIGDANADFEI